MMPSEIRRRLSYANVASSVALFIALGGTSYALTLPKDSVGAKQLRRASVGASELRTGSVRSLDIRNRTIALRDLATATRQRLRGQPGPPGPAGAPGVSYFLVADSAGLTVAGNGNVIGRPGAGQYVVRFPRSVTGCAVVASTARVRGGLVEDPPPGSTIVVADDGHGNALVRTFDQNRAATGLPFALIAAC